MNFFKNRSSKKVKPNLDERYLDAISNTDWQVLKRGDCFDPTMTNEAVVLGVAVWSHPDIEGLETLRRSSILVKLRICVFSVDDLTFGGIALFMPGIRPFSQTPIIAKYIDGKLVQTLEGRAALDWMQGNPAAIG